MSGIKATIEGPEWLLWQPPPEGEDDRVVVVDNHGEFEIYPTAGAGFFVGPSDKHKLRRLVIEPCRNGVLIRLNDLKANR